MGADRSRVEPCWSQAPALNPGRIGTRERESSAFPACETSVSKFPPKSSAYLDAQGGGSLLQLAGSAPIFSPKSVRLFILSLIKIPGTGGNQSPGIETIRT